MLDLHSVHFGDVQLGRPAVILLGLSGIGLGCGDSARPDVDARIPMGDSGFVRIDAAGFDASSGRDSGDRPVDATPPDTGVPVDGGALLPNPMSAEVEEFTTDSVNFVDVPGGALELPAAPDHSWLVMVSARLCTDTTTSPSVEARYVIDGVERGFGGVAVLEASRCGSFQHATALDPGTGIRRVQFALRNVENATATIADLHLVAVPLPPTADLHASENLPEQEVTADTPTPFASLTFTPASAGEYLVLTAASAFETNGSNNIVVATEDRTAGARWPQPAFTVPRPTWQTMFAAERRSFDATPQTISILVNRGLATTGRIRGAHIIAFRTDALGYIESATTASQTASILDTDDVQVTQLTSAPPPTVNAQVVLQSMAANVQCGLLGDHTPSFLVVEEDSSI